MTSSTCSDRPRSSNPCNSVPFGAGTGPRCDEGVTGPLLVSAGQENKPSPEVTLPHASAIELNCHSVRGIDGALIPILSPDVAWIVDPGSGWLPNFIDKIDFPSVLGNECWTRQTSRASLHASKLTR